MIQNKQTLTLALTLIVICIYAPELVAVSQFIYDAAIAADCMQRKAPEDTCAQFIANIELMMRVGAEHKEKVKEVLNEAPASNDPRMAEIVRVNKLRGVIKDAALAAQSQYDNRKVNEYLHVTQSSANMQSASDEKKNVENLYFAVLLQHMTPDLATYYKVKQILRIRTWFFDDHKPLKASQKAFFDMAKQS